VQNYLRRLDPRKQKLLICFE